MRICIIRIYTFGYKIHISLTAYPLICCLPPVPDYVAIIRGGRGNFFPKIKWIRSGSAGS